MEPSQGSDKGMDARNAVSLLRVAALATAILSMGAGYRTQNFIVTASTQEFAHQVAEAAEQYRRELALEWLGAELPPWQHPCPIRVQDGPQLGAGGQTSFVFRGAVPTEWDMFVQGSRERILDSVLPHEITHTVFATHFGRPLPRWADEGACTTVEHQSERQKQHELLYRFLTTGRGIAFDKMFAMENYPPDILPLYSQGYSLARFLIQQGGKNKFMEYVGDGMALNNWTAATQQHYGYHSLLDLQQNWLDWVRQGCPQVAANVHSASASSPQTQASANDSQPLETVAHLEPVRASQPLSGGWYKRQSEQLPGAADGPSTAQSTARPQPLGRPQQRVLEWR